MSENHTLRIHTQLMPAADPVTAVPDHKKRRARRRAGTASRARRSAPRPGDRLLRNSAIACAALLGILALGNLHEPWAQKAVDSIERALTMRIDLDDSLGELTFVRQLMPESTLVFLNVSGGDALTAPCSGALIHPWSATQPWLMFEASGDQVRAAGRGTVTAVSELSGGRWGLLIDHGSGLESVCAGLSEVAVRSGDAVERGQVLGTCAEKLYFELRSGGEVIDPTPRLGL